MKRNKFKQSEIGMIPEDWEARKIRDCCKLVKKQFSPSKDDVRKYIGLEHIEQQTLKLNGIGSSQDVESNKFEFKKGQILFGKLRPYFRKIYLPKFDGVCSTDIWVIDAREGFDTNYLFYFFADERIICEANNSSEGTKMPRARWDYLENLEYPFPPLEEQQFIAKILSDLDSKIELNQQMNKTLEDIGQALFKHWFIDFEFPNEKGKPYKSIGGKMVESELGEIPEGWGIGTVLDCATLLSGGTPKTGIPEYWNGEIPWVSAKDITNTQGPFILGTEKTISEMGVDNSNAKVLPKYTTVITARGTVGSHTMLSRSMAINQTNYGLKSKQGGSDFFVFFLVRNLVSRMQQHSYGTVFSTITTKTFEEMKAPIPPESVHTAFDLKVKPFMDRILKNLEESQTLARIRDILLPKLMSRQIRVPVR